MKSEMLEWPIRSVFRGVVGDRYLKYFHTVRHLKLQQIISRISRPLKRVDVRPVNGLKNRIPLHTFVPVQLHKRSLFDDNSFSFLGERGTLSGWNDPSKSKLWLYNLHYFDDLNSADAACRHDAHLSLVDLWITENPPTVGNGWEPYPISLRIVNWVKWLLRGGVATEKQLESLSIQAKVLSQTLEKHLLGNHLFANAKALLFAGLYFEGKAADRWLDLALSILKCQIPEQILGDGGNFELTPMYHATITTDLLDMVSLMAAYRDPRCDVLESECRHRLPFMLQWLGMMTHPDGYVSFFNDSAINIAPTMETLVSAAKSYGVLPAPSDDATLVRLAASGYFRLNLADAVMIGDVGEVGPDYIPGHAHADTLSFELSVFGRRLIVNSGTSVYGAGDERLRQRGTAAHNTVIVNGENSSEVWGGFRVARRAKPKNLFFDEDEGQIRCNHDGYSRLPGKPIHTRDWRYSSRAVCIVDSVKGSFKSAEARYHIHPSWQCELHDNILYCRVSDHLVKLVIKLGNPRLEPSTYHPEFGARIDNQVLIVPLTDASVEVEINW